MSVGQIFVKKVLHYKSKFGSEPTYCGKGWMMMPRGHSWYDPEPNNAMEHHPDLCPECEAEYGLRLLRKQRELKMHWSLEMAADVRAFHSVEAINELVAYLDED